MRIKSAGQTRWAQLCVAVLCVIGASVALAGSKQGAETPTTPPQAPPAGGQTVAPPPPRHEEAVMGPLERGVNRQGMDFSANGAHADNPAQCAEMCRTNEACKAVTYVVSQKTCWLKKLVPQPAQPSGPDFVSAVKVYPGRQ